jgi:hypothetical protein
VFGDFLAQEPMALTVWGEWVYDLPGIANNETAETGVIP